MAREKLKAELERYLGLAEEDARAHLATTYQQEVILHIDDWTDSMFKSWNTQATATSTDKVDRRKTKSNKYQNLKKIFDEGGQVTIDYLHTSLPKLRNPASRSTKGPSSSYKGEGKLSVFKHTGMIAIYLISPAIFNWESPQFSSAMTRGKTKGLKVINNKLKTEGYTRTLKEGAGGAGSDLWGHHGGISGNDPHSTYGLAGITKASKDLGKKIDPNLFEPVVDENNKLDSYSDVFWESVGKKIKANAYWNATYNTRRPSENPVKYDDKMNDEHIMRIVFGHKGFKGVQGGFDKGGKGWTKLGPTLEDLLTEVRKDVEDRITKQFKADGRKKADMSGSETPRTRVGKLAAEGVVRRLVRGAKKGAKKGSKGSVKVTFKVDPVKKSGKQKSKVTAKGKKLGSKSGSRRGARVPVKTKKPARGKTKSRSSVSMNPIGLQQLLNKALPAEVMKNMGPYPRKLENRTGRFAGSAEVTQVVPMPNSVEIRYDYQQDPYSVFEPGSGSPLASPGRDPRALIGGTIRQLAQSIMGTKYGLVRTKRV